MQYCCAVRQAKLQSFEAALHGRPVSSPAQYCVLPIVSQTVPAGQVADDAQVGVHCFGLPGKRARQTRGAAQSPSAVHASSACPLIVPPLVDVLLVLDVVLVLVLVLDVVLVLVPDVLLVLVPELDVLVAPPVPELVVVPVLDELVLPAPPAPGTHCAFTSHE